MGTAQGAATRAYNRAMTTRILIIHTSSLGDLVHMLPAISDIARHVPGALIDWVAEEAFAEIPAWHPAVHEVIPVAHRRWRKQWWSARARQERAALRTNLGARQYDVVGPICESTDKFAVGRQMPSVAPGDRLAFMSAGAYGAVLSSAYNARPLVPEVLVHGEKFDIVRRRPTFDEMVELEQVPDWLTRTA